MTKLYAALQGFLVGRRGATAVEYGLIASGLVLAVIAAMFAFGDDLPALMHSNAGPSTIVHANLTR